MEVSDERAGFGRRLQSTGKPTTAVPHNIRGFFVSCENGKEGRTANEMITALNEVRRRGSTPTLRPPVRVSRGSVEGQSAGEGDKRRGVLSTVRSLGFQVEEGWMY